MGNGRCTNTRQRVHPVEDAIDGSGAHSLRLRVKLWRGGYGPLTRRGCFRAQFAHVTDTQRESGAVEVVEQGDTELAAGTEQVAEGGGADLNMGFGVLAQQRACLFEVCRCEVQVRADAHDAAFA